MIKWVETKDITLFFSENPKIQIREILPSMTTFEKKEILDYPFMLIKNIVVTAFYHKQGIKYEFTIFKGFCWNGSDIPRFLWSIIGSKDETQFLVASCIHDFICLRHDVIKNNRRLSSELFKVCLIEAGVSNFKASLMCESVDIFQRLFCGW